MSEEPSYAAFIAQQDADRAMGHLINAERAAVHAGEQLDDLHEALARCQAQLIAEREELLERVALYELADERGAAAGIARALAALHTHTGGQYGLTDEQLQGTPKHEYAVVTLDAHGAVHAGSTVTVNGETRPVPVRTPAGNALVPVRVRMALSEMGWEVNPERRAQSDGKHLRYEVRPAARKPPPVVPDEVQEANYHRFATEHRERAERQANGDAQSRPIRSFFGFEEGDGR